MTLETREWCIVGQVQGVGFRPFIYRLAHHYQLKGQVRNEVGVVTIKATADTEVLNRFREDILQKAPMIAKPQIQSEHSLPLESFTAFTILPSKANQNPQIHLPPDYFTCKECLQELNNPQDRRYRYPFINCTQCGARYTLIEALPYDRANTSMHDFPLCKACQKEYDNPLDRRFHAEPVACPACGPSLQFVENRHHTSVGWAEARSPTHTSAKINDNEQALSACVAILQQGGIVALKGIGGYHLMCDASKEQAVAKLRTRKVRPDKPLALLFPETGQQGLDTVQHYVEIKANEAALLTSAARPIVLLKQTHNPTTPTPLATNIAPSLDEIGVMLAYSPLHHLLLSDFGKPLVATSGNISGEPVLTENAEAEKRLVKIADAFLHHNRPIVRPADDSVFRTIAKIPRPIRLGRGTSPLEIELPKTLEQPVIAVGGHMKNTIALAWQNRAVISPHIGDLGSPKSLATFVQTIEDLQTIYQVSAQHVICDAHPTYSSSRWAKHSGLPVSEVWHHYAHASALYGEYYAEIVENAEDGRCIVFTWDGTGLGSDHTLWGGEALLGKPGDWQRVGSFRPFSLPGGDKAGREPWRSAAALCWESGRDYDIGIGTTDLLRQAWQKGMNSPQSSAVGRLFDAAAVLLGIAPKSSFEGQAPMYLEALASKHKNQVQPIDLPLTQDSQSIWRTDWEPMLDFLCDSRHDRDRVVEDKAACFHLTLAHALLQQAQQCRSLYDINQVGLSGGVFQNKLLTEMAYSLLVDHGFDVFIGKRIPLNDAGISYGQIIEYMGS